MYENLKTVQIQTYDMAAKYVTSLHRFLLALLNFISTTLYGIDILVKSQIKFHSEQKMKMCLKLAMPQTVNCTRA